MIVYILYTFFTGRLPGEVFDFYLSLLPKPMQANVLKYRRWEDAQASLLGKMLLTKALQKYGLETDELGKIQYTKYNRPFLNGPLDFSISHSGNCVLCAISSGYSLGIDVEEVKPIVIHDFDSQFSDEEMASIYSAENQLYEFYSWWTRKEAVIKADGRGMSIPLTNIVFHTTEEVSLTNKSWHIRQIDLSKTYCVHLATAEKVEDNIEIEEFAF